ncbi:tetratricopeptide repeat protein [Microbispora rosea]|uniref:tetratricopeptide repeat protein n=1 Tax=Microbispora rosea TaxID=58117 RepID=UPI0036AAD7DD
MQRERVVAIDGSAGKGSGYVVAARLMLASAHVTGPVGTAVTVFHPGHDGAYDGRVVWAGTPRGRDDAALVAVTDPDWRLVEGPAVRWGRTVTYQPQVPCAIWGRPNLAQRPGRPVELWQKSGRVNPGSGYVHDRYVIELDGHPPAAEGGLDSPWGGMSGAGLLCGNLLAGVLAADSAHLAHGTLTAVPAYVLYEDPDFRQVLAEHTGQYLPALEAIEWQDLIDEGDPVTPLGVPVSPASLLRARRPVVPFTGRDDMLAVLDGWVRRPGFGAFLIHGPAGQGKTRLAQHLAEQLSGRGWAATWLKDPATDLVAATAQGLEVVTHTVTPLLIIVDYAESRIGQLRALLAACARRPGTSPVKLLLLARTAGPWWQDLTDDRIAEHLLAGTPVWDLPPLDPGPGSHVDAYRHALTAFADALAGLPGWRDRPWVQSATALTGPSRPNQPGLDNALTLHMTALADLLDHTSRAGGDDDLTLWDAGADQVEDRLLKHERRYWKATASTPPHQLHPTISMPTLTDALATATAFGAAERQQADTLLARVPGLADQPGDRRRGVWDWIAALYPGTVTTPWGSLQPDRLTERFWGRRLQERPDLVDDLLAVDDPHTPEVPLPTQAQVVRMLTVFTRAAAHPVFGEDLATRLTQVCLHNPKVLIEPAIQVATAVERPGPLLAALHHHLEQSDVDPAELQQWANRLPDTSQTLAEWAAQLTDRLTRHHRDTGDLVNLARSLNNHAVRLGELGRREEALEAITETVGLYRDLAEARPDAFLHHLARSLNNQANRLGALGRPEQALEAITEAVTIRRALAEARPDAFLPDLALSLNNHAVHLGELGRLEDALEAITEAVTIRRALAEARPDAFLPDLALSLNNQANCLGQLGRPERALEAITEAVGLHRGLAEARPQAFLPNLAGSLNNQASRLGALGRLEDALEAISEAVTIRRALAEARPDAFLPYLAGSLNNQAVYQGELGRLERALEAIIEAVGLYRGLAEARPQAFLPDLAMSLNNQANRLGALGRPEQALEAITEAVGLHRGLAEARPDAFLPDLAMSLNNQANSLGELGRRKEALKAITEAVTIRRALAEARPDAFLPDLATSLNNQAVYQGALGRYEEALKAITETVDLYRGLAEARPDAFLPDLAMSLNNQANCLGELGRREDALKAITEAVTIRRTLAEARPAVHQRELEQSLRVQTMLEQVDGS